MNDRLLFEQKDDLTVANADTLTVYEYDFNPDGTTTGGPLTVQTAKTVKESASGSVLESHRYQFNNQGRLARTEVTKNGLTTITAYEYDDDGVRVRQEDIDPTDGITVLSTTEYLIDSQNHTGYAKPIEEHLDGVLDRTYTIGHQIVTQADHSTGTVHHFLHDGHGSTRALLDGVGAVDSYDAFGEPIGFDPATAATTWLFGGDGQYDRASELTNHIDRWRQGHIFVSLDRFAGDSQDPLSLHKYLYANANPVQFVDPTGKFGITGLAAGFSVSNAIQSIKIEVDLAAFQAADSTTSGIGLQQQLLVFAGGTLLGAAVGRSMPPRRSWH